MTLKCNHRIMRFDLVVGVTCTEPVKRTKYSSHRPEEHQYVSLDLHIVLRMDRLL